MVRVIQACMVQVLCIRMGPAEACRSMVLVEMGGASV
jgi:hypothetical protein